MQKFLKWLIITSVITVVYGVLEVKFQLFSEMARLDPTYICFIIWGVMALIVLDPLLSGKRLALLAFVATILGTAGTFISMREAILPIVEAGVNPDNVEEFKTISAGMFGYFGVALATSITGFFAAIPAYVYLYFGDSDAL